MHMTLAVEIKQAMVRIGYEAQEV
jgi:hypothetical protein